MSERTDFNDLAQEAGPDAVRKSIAAAMPATAAPQGQEAEQFDEPLPFGRIASSTPGASVFWMRSTAATWPPLQVYAMTPLLSATPQVARCWAALSPA
jgi:hypothetical protein